MKKTIFLSIAVCLLASCGKLTVDNTPVASIELDRYLGTWYEIARFDHRFERGLTQPQAEYSLREDGKIDVVNTGLKDGKEKRSTAVAKTTDTPALLRVSFFRPFYGDYRVLLLDEDYQYARWSAAVRMIFCGSLPASRSWTKRPSRSFSPKPNAEAMTHPNCCGCIDFAGLIR